MKKPTEKQIENEIKALTELRPKIPRRTMFGDDNWEVIDAEIRALQERMDEDKAYSEFDDPDDDERRALDGALESVHWMEGEEKDPPSEGWKPLIKS